MCVCEVRQCAGIAVGAVHDTVMYLSQGVALVKSVISNIPASPPLLAPPPSCCSIVHHHHYNTTRRFFYFKISRLHLIRIIRLTFNPAWKTAGLGFGHPSLSSVHQRTMPPKKQQGGPNKKTVEKKKDKVIEVNLGSRHQRVLMNIAPRGGVCGAIPSQ